MAVYKMAAVPCSLFIGGLGSLPHGTLPKVAHDEVAGFLQIK